MRKRQRIQGSLLLLSLLAVLVSMAGSAAWAADANQGGNKDEEVLYWATYERPIALMFADEQGRRIDGTLNLEAGRPYKIYVDVVDQGNNGSTADDYMEIGRSVALNLRGMEGQIAEIITRNAERGTPDLLSADVPSPAALVSYINSSGNKKMQEELQTVLENVYQRDPIRLASYHITMDEARLQVQRESLPYTGSKPKRISVLNLYPLREIPLPDLQDKDNIIFQLTYDTYYGRASDVTGSGSLETIKSSPGYLQGPSVAVFVYPKDMGGGTSTTVAAVVIF